jgi:hypothetical protein
LNEEKEKEMHAKIERPIDLPKFQSQSQSQRKRNRAQEEQLEQESSADALEQHQARDRICKNSAKREMKTGHRKMQELRA